MAARIWDIFLVEGRKTLFRFALAMMKINQKEFLQENEMGEFYKILPKYRETVQVEELF